MARILLHTLVFAPDGVSTSVLLSELMQDLQAQGHTVSVLTARPHYNHDADAEARQPLHPRLGGLYAVSEHHGMRVVHVYIPRKGERVGGRMRDYLIFHALSLILGLFLFGRQDLVIAPSPPLSIGVIGWLLARLKGAQFIYNVRELYPALVEQMGLLSQDSTLYRILAGLERFVYARSWRIVVICQYFRRHITALGFPDARIVTIPDFVDDEFIRPLPRETALSRELGLDDKFVVLYAGNIGMTQSFETLLPVMARLQDIPDLHFLIVGDGVRRSWLEGEVRARGLHNVTLLPYQPRGRVPEIYATADLCLVPLMAGMAQTTIPSKIYTIMASGRPALVAVDPDSELVDFVQEAECGLAVAPDDADALEAGLRQAYAAREHFAALGLNGRGYAEAHFSRRAVNRQFAVLLNQL